MEFFALKIAWSILQPTAAIALLFAAGIVLRMKRRERAGTRLLTAGALLYLMLGCSPLGNWLIIPLENWVPGANEADLAGVSGIVVLGGAMDTIVSAARKEPQLNEAAERMTETVRLASRIPNVPVVFSGGNGDILYRGASEARIAGQFFEGFGLGPPRLVLEDRSKNTRENAAFTADLVHPALGQKWVLVTSAYHMPRAKALFEANGFEIVPWPVDYRTRGWRDGFRLFAQPSQGLRRVDLAVKEWISLGLTWLRPGSSHKAAKSEA